MITNDPYKAEALQRLMNALIIAGFVILALLVLLLRIGR